MIACGDDRFPMVSGVVCLCVCACVRAFACVLHLNKNSLKFPKAETEFKSYSNFKNSSLSIAGQPTFEFKDCHPQLKSRMIFIIQCNNYL